MDEVVVHLFECGRHIGRILLDALEMPRRAAGALNTPGSEVGHTIASRGESLETASQKLTQEWVPGQSL